MPTIDRYFVLGSPNCRWVVSEPITEDMLEQRNGRYVRYPRQAVFAEVIYGEEAEAMARAFAADAAERGWDAAYDALATD